MSRFRAVFRGLFSLLALVALVGAAPWALARWGQLPGTRTGDWWERLSDTVVSDRTVFVVLTVTAWVVWAVFTVSVLIESVAGLRGIQAPRLGFAGPLQRAARVLVIGVLMTVSLAQHAPAFAGSRTAAPIPLPTRDTTSTVVVQLPADTPTPPDDAPHSANGSGESTSAPAASAIPGGVITVALHDSPWSLAEAHLGDGLRWRDLWELNRNIPQPDGRAWTDPQIIVPGWQLRLPVPQPNGETPPQTAPPDAETPDAVPSDAPGVVHVVARGDTLTAIAEQYLGDSRRYPEIFTANTNVVQPDGRRLTDPNLIVPGWQLTIPNTQPRTTPPTPTKGTNEPPAGDPGTIPADPAPGAPSPSAPAPTPQPPNAPSTKPASSSSTEQPPSTTSPTTSPTPPPDHTTSVASGAVANGEDDTSVAPVVAGISGAVALATGIALRMRWLRRRRATRGARHQSLPPSPIELAALHAADVPLVRWAGQHLARLVRDVDRRQLTAGPVAVELSVDAGIEVLWDAPQHAATPHGWAAADGGWAWRLAYDPDEPIPADELSAAIPALVTVGQRDGRQLLVDLEAFGLVTVAGPVEHTDAFIRSLSVELVCGNDLSDAYVTVVDVDTGLDSQDRLTVTDADAATGQLHGTQRSVAEVLEHAAVSGTFAARAGDTTPIEASIVVAHATAEQVAVYGSIVIARHGVAAVLAVDGAVAPTTGAHIEIGPSGSSARLEPLGLVFTPVGIPTTISDALHANLTALGELPDEPTTITVDPSPAGTNGNGHRHGVTDPLRTSIDHVAFAPATGEQVANGAGNGRHTDEDAHGDGSELNERAVTSNASLDDRLFEMAPPPNAPALVIRVLGVPAIPELPSLGRRELILATLLACRGGSLPASAAQDALWGGKPVEAKTAWNLYTATRRQLGSFDDDTPVMPSTDRARGQLRLDPRVTTDLAILGGLLDRARHASSVEAATLLRDGLALVEGLPFDAPGYDWAHRDQDVASAATVIEQAVDLAVDLAMDADQLDVARQAIIRGLRGLPGDEHLYRRRMRVEAHAGNHAGIVAAYDELTIYLADFDTLPSTATTALYHELIGSTRPARGPLN